MPGIDPASSMPSNMMIDVAHSGMPGTRNQRQRYCVDDIGTDQPPRHEHRVESRQDDDADGARADGSQRDDRAKSKPQQDRGKWTGWRIGRLGQHFHAFLGDNGIEQNRERTQNKCSRERRLDDAGNRSHIGIEIAQERQHRNCAGDTARRQPAHDWPVDVSEVVVARCGARLSQARRTTNPCQPPGLAERRLG